MLHPFFVKLICLLHIACPAFAFEKVSRCWSEMFASIDLPFSSRYLSSLTLGKRPRGRHISRTCPHCGHAELQNLRSRAHCRPHSEGLYTLVMVPFLWKIMICLLCGPLALEIQLSTWKPEMEVPSYVRAVSWKADGRGGEITIPSFSIHSLVSLPSDVVSLRAGGRGGEGGGIPSLPSSQCSTSRGSLGLR